MDDLYEKYISAADIAVVFGQMGGNADEFVRFLQLEWESYSEDDIDQEQKSRFYRQIRDYVKYRTRNRDWRKEFSSRDFNDLLV